MIFGWFFVKRPKSSETRPPNKFLGAEWEPGPIGNQSTGGRPAVNRSLTGALWPSTAPRERPHYQRLLINRQGVVEKQPATKTRIPHTLGQRPGEFT